VAGLIRSSGVGAGFAAGFARSAADEKEHVDTIWLIQGLCFYTLNVPFLSVF
jgi:hypothetical protein